MRFRPDLVELIRNGRKTEARYPIAKRVKVEPGKSYAAQPGGDKATCRIWVTDVYDQVFDDLEHQDVMRDGFRDLDEFLAHWRDQFGQDIDWGHRMRVVRFELYKAQDAKPFVPKDVVRLLVNQQGRKDAGQYTSSRMAALPDEPEAIDPKVVQNLPASLEAHQRWVKDRTQREAAYYQGTATERLDRALADARANRIDTSSIERLLERKATELERRIQRAA